MYEERNELNSMYAEEKAGLDERRVATYLAKVMGWMCLGLFTTLVFAMVCMTSPAVIYYLSYTNAIYGIFIAQLVVVMAMSFGMNRVGPGAATVMFMLYAALTGVTFSALFMMFEIYSVIFVFGITAIVFVSLAVYGFVTKRDLTRIGTLAIFGLLGIILAGIVNWFIGSSMLDFGITCIGIVIFIALTAYDTQKIKAFYISAVESGYDEYSPEVRKLAIFGALTLYLDFINLFLKLLRLLGKRRN